MSEAFTAVLYKGSEFRVFEDGSVQVGVHSLALQAAPDGTRHAVRSTRWVPVTEDWLIRRARKRVAEKRMAEWAQRLGH